MDVVVPLGKSSSGNRFTLALCDHAKRFPEPRASPLHLVSAIVVGYGSRPRFLAGYGNMLLSSWSD